MLKLKIIKGPEGQGRQFNLETGRSVTIGRGADAEVKLSAAGVSKAHAKLTALNSSKVELEDLGSSNGTFVNGLLVKKHVLNIGDALVIHPFVLQIEAVAPEPISPGPAFTPSGDGFGAGAFGSATIDVQATPSSTAASPSGSGSKVRDFLASNVFPIADGMSGRFDVRLLVAAFFVLWSLLIVVFTAMPFSERANERVGAESIEVAKLYARQLVRVNQQAILDQRYRDLVSELDARRGQTPRVIRTLILDAAKAQILAPTEMLGRPVPDTFAANALTYPDVHVQTDREGVAYVSAPLKFHDPDKGIDVISAVAFVEYDSAGARFTLANILDQAVSSFLYALLATIFFVLLVYRWTEGSIEAVLGKIDEALKRGELQIVAPVKWPVIAQLCEQISVVLGRASGGGVEVVGGSSDWASQAVAASGGAAAAFDSSLVVVAWNEGMERIAGVRANLAVGSDISGASRDVAFESTVRDLSSQAAGQGGRVVSTALDFSGRPHRLRMVQSDGAYFLTIVEEG